MTLSRRSLILGGTALMAVGLSGCAQTKFRRYNGPQVTGLAVFKSRRRLYVMHGSQALKSYDIDLGFAPMGHKIQEGDGKTPEGYYMIDRRNPNSDFHLSLGISYPDAEDRARAEALGVRPGGDIFIHGTPREKSRARDWTAGCIAVTNREMEDIYAMVPDGVPIAIYP